MPNGASLFIKDSTPSIKVGGASFLSIHLDISDYFHNNCIFYLAVAWGILFPPVGTLYITGHFYLSG